MPNPRGLGQEDGQPLRRDSGGLGHPLPKGERCAYAEPAHPRVSNIHVQLTWLRCSQVWDTVVDAEAFASGELQSATEEEMWERFEYFLHELV